MRCEPFIFALFLGCVLVVPVANAQVQVPADCPVTRPPDPPFVPPPPYITPGGRFLLGTTALWTMLNSDGTWARAGVGDKFWWWRKGWTPNDDPDRRPQLFVTAQRLDGQPPVVKLGPGTNGRWPTGGWAMLVGLALPTEGCWEIIGTYRSESLSMIVYVPPSEPRSNSVANR